MKKISIAVCVFLSVIQISCSTDKTTKQTYSFRKTATPIWIETAQGREFIDNINAKVTHGKSYLTHLHTYAQANDCKAVQELVDAGLPVDIKDGGGGTALHTAGLCDAFEAAQKLIDLKADLDAKTYQGYSPLHLSSGGNSKRVTELLIHKGAPLNPTNNYGETPLDVASANGALKTLPLLLNAGAKRAILGKNTQKTY
jgi:ankyrin repeat protein